MDAILQNTKQPLFVPVSMNAVGIIAGKWVALQTQSLDRRGLFLIAKEYICPNSTFELMLWNEEKEAPIYAEMKTTFVERSWSGYGIGAEIVGISSRHEKRWAAAYQSAVAASTPSYGETLCLSQALRRRRMLVVEAALGREITQALSKLGVAVERADSAERALFRAKRGGIDLVVAAQEKGGKDACELCRELSKLPSVNRKGGPKSLVLTGCGTKQNFEGPLYAGAAKVIAATDNAALLVSRILEVLYRSAGAEDDQNREEDPLELAPLPRRMKRVSRFDRATARVHGLIRSARLFFHSSTYARLSALTFS